MPCLKRFNRLQRVSFRFFSLCFLNCFTRFFGGGFSRPRGPPPLLTLCRLRCVCLLLLLHVACCMLQLPCGLSAGVLPLDRLQLDAGHATRLRCARALSLTLSRYFAPLSALSFPLNCSMQKHLTSVLAVCCVFFCAFLDNFSCVSLPRSLLFPLPLSVRVCCTKIAQLMAIKSCAGLKTDSDLNLTSVLAHFSQPNCACRLEFLFFWLNLLLVKRRGKGAAQGKKKECARAAGSTLTLSLSLSSTRL